MSNPRLNAVDSPNFPVVLQQSAVAVSCPVDTSEDVLAAIPIPANTIGLNGRLRITTLWTVTNNANNKNLRCRLGGIGGTDYLAVNIVNLVAMRQQIEIANRGAANSQIGFTANQAGFASTAGANITSAIDTSVAQVLLITGQKAVGGDTITLESYIVELIPG